MIHNNASCISTKSQRTDFLEYICIIILVVLEELKILPHCSNNVLSLGKLTSTSWLRGDIPFAVAS